MFKKNFNSSVVDSLIGENTTFKGNIESNGTIKIEGKVIGDISAGGDVFIGEKALIKGNLNAQNIHFSGTVEGNVRARGILHLMSTAKLTGDIEVHSFVADEGAVFHGNCSMIETAAEGNEVVDSEKTVRKYKKSSSINKLYNEAEE